MTSPAGPQTSERSPLAPPERTRGGPQAAPIVHPDTTAPVRAKTRNGKQLFNLN